MILVRTKTDWEKRNFEINLVPRKKSRKEVYLSIRERGKENNTYINAGKPSVVLV